MRIGSTTLELADAGAAPAAPAPATPRPRPLPLRRPARAGSGPAPAARARRPRARRPLPRTAAELASELPPGSVFAGCRVEEVIGQGDMGVVYRAEELALQRPVALKLILPEHSREERFRERFRRESRIAAAIDHPNVIPIFDAGDEDGVLYIMMRLVEGTDLRALIAAEGRIEPLRAARIVRQVGAALDAAHARGMLHRDVKPSNVLLAREDHVYLSDFGLAKHAAADGGLTRQGSIVARAEYVAPEQILNQRVDARADVYALGCLLFEALTGEAPFATLAGGSGSAGPRRRPAGRRPSSCAPSCLASSTTSCAGRWRRIRASAIRRPATSDRPRSWPPAGCRRASPWSVVATGDAAPSVGDQPVQALAAGPRAPALQGAAAAPGAPARQGAAAGPRAPASERAQDGRADPFRWAIALAALAIVAVGMVAALHGISTL